MSKTPTVSVLITSYNRASTIRRAIDSVLAQRTTFGVQVIVVDDGSTDGSVDIIREYYDRGDISVFHCMEHYGMMVCYREGFKRCDGEYIAMCDCDDYWIHPDRLQWQVEYMESRPWVGLCLTKVLTEVDGILNLEYPDSPLYSRRITYDGLLRGNAYLFAQSYLIRKSDLDRYVDFSRFMSMSVWDLPIVLELIRHTEFKCMDFYSAVYVKNQESATNTRSRTRRLRYVMGNHRIRLWFMVRYGCRPGTAAWFVYRVCRDLVSVVLKRWI